MFRQVGILTVSLAVLFIMILAPVAVNGMVYENGEQPQRRMIPGKVVVQFEDDVDLTSPAKAFGKVNFGIPSLDAVLGDLQVNDFRKVFPWRTERPKVNSGMHDLTRFYELTFPEETPVREVINELLQNPHVRMAEPEWEIPLAATPNDPLWGDQWAMEPPGPDPDYYTAWDTEAGSDSIIYGCIDSGVNYKHADLEDNIWVNPGEDLDGDGVVYDIDDLNGVDDDGNGIVDDLIGYDFLRSASVWPGEDGGGVDPDPNDFDGHGTHVAGIGAAANNNLTSVTGAAGGWFGGHRSYRGVRIMCLRVGYTGTDGKGYVNSLDCATAIDYATMMGANVINASWGGASVNAVAAANAMAAGVTFCHAAGNSNADEPDELDNQPGMLSVASVGPSSDTKSSFSNHGFWIDVCAPGSEILSTYSSQYTPTTATLSGTSMASPMVAGLALLIRSAMPSLTKGQVDSIIVNTTDPVEYANDPIYHFRLGTGRINAASALAGLASAKFTSDVTDGQAPLTVQFTDLSPYSPTAWNWSFGTGDSSTQQNPEYTYTAAGVYDVSLIVDDSSSLGPGEEHLKRYIWAQADSLKLDSLDIKAGTAGVVLPVYLANTAQVSDILFVFELQGHDNQKVEFDSLSVAGTRADYFETVQKVAASSLQQKFAYRLRPNATDGSTYLQPDTGILLNLYVTVNLNATDGQVVTIDTVSFAGNSSSIATTVGSFWPDYTPGKIVVTQCAHGDVDCNGTINVADLTFLVNYLFQGGPAPDSRGGDVDGSGFIQVADVTYLVDYLFRGGPPPPA